MSDLAAALALLEVRLDAFAVCEVQNGWGLKVDALDKVLLHFVLQGEGSIQSEHGIVPLKAPMMVIVPKVLPKQINGAGPVTNVSQASESCPLTDGIIRFQACRDRADLVLGCGAVTASVGGIPLFDHLQVPLAVQAKDAVLPHLFAAALAELRQPAAGSKPIVEALLKQILIILLRCHLKDGWDDSPLRLSKKHPQLSQAIVAMTSKPEERHTLTSLAALVGMSQSRFTHHFAATYGRNAMEFLQAIRLKKAAELLQEPGMLVKSTCSAVGFTSRSHFSRAFRAKYGIDPTAYRKLHRALKPSSAGSEPQEACTFDEEGLAQAAE
jgi:AraC-like DNA-binding protein